MKVIAFLIGVFSLSCLAATDSLTCNGCSTNGMENLAAFSQQRSGSSYVVIFDFDNRQVKKYYRSLRFSSFGEPIRNAVNVELSYEEQFDANLILEFRQEVILLLKNKSVAMFVSNDAETDYMGTDSSQSIAAFSRVEISNQESTSSVLKDVGGFDVKGDPYTFLSRSSFRNNAFDYYLNQDGSLFSELIDSALDAVRIPTGKDMGLYVTINFYESADKSIYHGSVKAAIDFTNDVFIIMSAKDADNNSIPLKVSDLNNEFVFKNKSNGETIFLNYINLLFDSHGGHTPNCVVTSHRTQGDQHIFTYSCK